MKTFVNLLMVLFLFAIAGVARAESADMAKYHPMSERCVKAAMVEDMAEKYGQKVPRAYADDVKQCNEAAKKLSTQQSRPISNVGFKR